MKINLTLYFLILVVSTTLTFYLDKSIGIYFPIIWLLFGFGFEWFRFMGLYLNISGKLIKDQQTLDKLKLEVHPNKSQILMTSLFSNFLNIQKIRPELENKINDTKATFKLAIFGFLIGIIQVITLALL